MRWYLFNIIDNKIITESFNSKKYFDKKLKAIYYKDKDN